MVDTFSRCVHGRRIADHPAMVLPMPITQHKRGVPMNRGTGSTVVDRRTALKTGAGLLAALTALRVGSPADAQEATPIGSPVAGGRDSTPRCDSAPSNPRRTRT